MYTKYCNYLLTSTGSRWDSSTEETQVSDEVDFYSGVTTGVEDVAGKYTLDWHFAAGAERAHEFFNTGLKILIVTDIFQSQF